MNWKRKRLQNQIFLVQPLGRVFLWRHSFYPMIDYSNRSYKKELLDRDDIPFDDIRQNMKELDFINTYLGGHSITISGLKKLIGNRQSVSVCEIGCGGGDNLNAISKWAKKNKVK